MALTKVTGHVVKPDTNIEFHNTKSTGIVTFTHTSNATSSTTGALQITGGVGIVKDLHVGGNVTVGGTLTYDDVTNIDSIGIITARDGVFLPDNKQVKLGNTAASPDFKIYHNTVANTTSPPNYLYPNSNYIDSVAAANLFIRTSTAGIYLGRTDGAHAASFHTNTAGVVLYHNASGGGGEKFRTVAGGISVTGSIASSGGLTVTSGNIRTNDGGVSIFGAGGAVLYLNDSNDNPDYQLQNVDGAFAIKDSTNNVERLSITSGGIVGINSTSPTGAQLVIKNSDDSNLNAITILNDNGNMSSSLSQDSNGAGSYLQKDNAGNIKTFIRSYNTSYFLGGNIGIGSAVPSELLDIGGNTTIASNGRVNIYRPTGTATNSAFVINSNVGSTNSTQFIIQAGGSVGIGSAIPSRQLDVSGNIRASVLYLDRHGSPTINMVSTSDTGGGAIYFGSPASGVRGGILYDHNGDKLKLRNIYGTSIEIDNARKSTFSGDIQITKPLAGDPGANLTLQTHATAQATARLYFKARDNANNEETSYIEAASGNTANVDLNFAVNNSVKLHITSDGTIGVNQTSPISVFHVKHHDNNSADITIEGGGTGNAGLKFIPGGQTNTYFAYVDTNRNFRIQDHTAERLRIVAGGKVLIGNGTYYSPSGMLHIVGDDNSNGPELYLMVPNNNVTDNIGALVFGNNIDKSVCMIRGSTHTANNTGEIQFHTSTTGTMSEKLRITSHGGTIVNKGGSPNTASGWAGLEVKAAASEHQLVLSSTDTASNSNQARLGFKLHPSNDNERVKAAIVCQGNGGGYGEVGRMMFCLDNVADNGNALPNSSSDEKLRIDVSGMITLGNTSNGVLKAEVCNSVNGHYFVSQCDDNNNGFEIYQQHGSTTTRNTLAVYNNSTGSKHLNFYCRGDNQVHISTNKDSVGLVLDGTSSGTYYGETGATLDFRMLNEVNQFTGNPAARIASYLERGNNGFGLKFFARHSAGTFAAMAQLSPDYEFEPCSDQLCDLGSPDRSWDQAYIANAYPDQGTEYRITSGSYSNGQWHDTAFRRNSMGGLNTNGVYIVTAYADLYQAMGGNYSCNYTWIVGVRDQYTNQTLVNTCPLLSVTGHSTNNFGASGATVGDGIRLGTRREPSASGGQEYIVWRPAASTGTIDNTAGRTLVFRVQRIGRSSLG